MSRQKVAFCTDGIYPYALGGMQKHSRLLIEELAGFDDIELVVIHPHSHKVFNRSDIQEISIPGIDEKKNYLLECYNYSRRVYAQLSVINPNVVYSQGLSVWSGVKNIKDKFIINPHGLEPYQATGLKFRLMGLPFRLIFNHLFKQASVVISLGGKLTPILRKKCSKKGRLVEVPNAANSPGNPPHKADCNTIKALFVARFADNKGINILFDAIRELKEEGLHNKIEFTLAGTGPLYDFYVSHNTYPNVSLMGFVPDDQIPALYQTHDVFILPTLFEGMPTAVLEAMSYGLPVIVSDVGATAELVNENNGKIINPGSVDELVSAIKWFMSLSAQERTKLSESSFKKFKERFTWPVVAKQYSQLFKTFPSG